MSRIFPFLALILLLFASNWSHATNSSRFFFSGDGVLYLNHQKIQFRNPDHTYSESGLKQIHRLFKAPWNNPAERLSLRFIEILDYLQDQLKGGTYRIRSGYRAPKYNQSLRNQGKMAAQSSMHVEGAAADLILNGVPSRKIFEYVKSLNCCGIGWYHTAHFHIDTGPARYWDEKTSKTEDKKPQLNEKIILQTDFDRYSPGETMNVKFMRVTNYPIGISVKWELVPQLTKISRKRIKRLNVQISADIQGENECYFISNRAQARLLKVKLPKKLAKGYYGIKVTFCNRFHYEKMPEFIVSRRFYVY